MSTTKHLIAAIIGMVLILIGAYAYNVAQFDRGLHDNRNQPAAHSGP